MLSHWACSRLAGGGQSCVAPDGRVRGRAGDGFAAAAAPAPPTWPAVADLAAAGAVPAATGPAPASPASVKEATTRQAPVAAMNLERTKEIPHPMLRATGAAPGTGAVIDRQGSAV
jgi:hypothetical protein